VANKAFEISLTFAWLILSPTLTGIAVKMLPMETRCKPIILISVIKNSSKAEVESDIKARK
jgi:hypothetical protein